MTPQIFKDKEKTDAGLSADNIETLHPGIYASLRDRFIAEGKLAEKKYIARLKKCCGDNPKLLGQCLISKETAREVLLTAVEQLEAENKRTDDRLDHAREIEALKNLTEAQLRSKYFNSQNLQDEFHSEAAYLAYLKNEIKVAHRINQDNNIQKRSIKNDTNYK